MKVVTFVGTRPEIIKLSRVIPELKKHTNHRLVHTGQNYDYELNEIFFDELEIDQPDFYLNAAGQSAAETIGKVIIEADRILASEMPDAGVGPLAAMPCTVPATRSARVADSSHPSTAAQAPASQ